MEEDDTTRIAMYSTIEEGDTLCVHVDRMVYDLVSVCRINGMSKEDCLKGVSIAWDDEANHLVVNIPDNLKN